MAYERYWVGLDAGHLETAVCLIDETGLVLFQAMRETKSGPVRDILRQFGVESVQLITVEAGVGTHMVRQLCLSGLPVQVVDVRKSSKFLAIQRQKTDANDAKGLAELGRLGRSIKADVFVKPLEHQNIRIKLNIRRNLLKHRAKTDALIQSIIRLHGGNIRILNGRGALAAEVNFQIAQMRRDGLELGADIMPLVDIAEALRVHIAKIDKQIRSLASDNLVCANFQTIPGVGPITALSFYSAVGDPSRFKRNRDIGAYLGMTPTLRQSGLTSRRGRISRFGNKMTRTHLVAAATVLLCNIKQDSALRSWGLELASRAGLPKARVAVARKLATILLRMWKSGSAFEPFYRSTGFLQAEEAGLDSGSISGNPIPL